MRECAKNGVFTPKMHEIAGFKTPCANGEMAHILDPELLETPWMTDLPWEKLHGQLQLGEEAKAPGRGLSSSYTAHQPNLANPIRNLRFMADTTHVWLCWG